MSAKGEKVIPFADIGSQEEADQLDIIAGYMGANPGQTPGFMVENDVKADRYVEGLRARVPGLIEIERTEVGPPGGPRVLLVRVGVGQ